MAWMPFTDEETVRFAELAELFAECREAFRYLNLEAGWRAVEGSPAAADWESLAARQALPEGVFFLITQLLHTYLYAAGEQLGGLAALYAQGEVLLAPSVLARSVAEHCAHVLWVLGKPEDPLDHRLARTFLEEIASAEHAKMNAGRLFGKDHAQHRRWADWYRTIRTDAAAIFPAPHADADGRPMLLGYQLPSPEGVVVWMHEFVSPSLAGDLSRGVYGFLSNYTHPTLYATRELFTTVERDGRITADVHRDIGYHENLARHAVVPFYHALAYVWTYHGWAGDRFAELTGQIERLLPRTLLDDDRVEDAEPRDTV